MYVVVYIILDLYSSSIFSKYPKILESQISQDLELSIILLLAPRTAQTVSFDLESGNRCLSASAHARGF